MMKSVAAVLVSMASLGAAAAHATNVSWSIDISTPLPGTVVTDAPSFAYAPVPARVPVYVVDSGDVQELSYGYAPRVYEHRPVPVYRVPLRAVPEVYYAPRHGRVHAVPIAYIRDERHGDWRHSSHHWRDHRDDRDHLDLRDGRHGTGHRGYEGRNRHHD